MFKKSEVDLIACVQTSSLPQKKIGRRKVCESLSLIVFRLHLHKLLFLFFSLTVEKVLTDLDFFRARTQLFSPMFSTFIAKLVSSN